MKTSRRISRQRKIEQQWAKRSGVVTVVRAPLCGCGRYPKGKAHRCVLTL